MPWTKYLWNMMKMANSGTSDSTDMAKIAPQLVIDIDSCHMCASVAKRNRR